MMAELEQAHKRRGFRMLGVQVLLGAAAAVAGMTIIRMVGGSEIVVALMIGLVPGVSERSIKKLLGGAVLAVVGYSVGAQVGMLVARSASGVPLGHWAITGAFIGLTAGIRRFPEQGSFSRFTGASAGFILGLVFGILGDIGGFFTIPASDLPLFFYLREISLLCAGIFINLAAGIASLLTAALHNRSSRRQTAAAEAHA